MSMATFREVFGPYIKGELSPLLAAALVEELSVEKERSRLSAVLRFGGCRIRSFFRRKSRWRHLCPSMWWSFFLVIPGNAWDRRALTP